MNLIALTKRFPDNLEARTSLILHMAEEERAIEEYETARRRLGALILSADFTPNIGPKSERKKRNKTDESTGS